jgi:hypothetical protein
LALCALCGAARADGIDIAQWLLQLPQGDGPGATIALLVLLLAIDYGLNFLVIGWPMKAWSGLPLGKVAKELVWYTLCAQLADRVGALLAIPAAIALAPMFDTHGFVAPLLLASVLVAIGIGFVVLAFARRRWGLSRGRAWTLSVAGAILTHPVLGFVVLGALRRPGG